MTIHTTAFFKDFIFFIWCLFAVSTIFFFFSLLNYIEIRLKVELQEFCTVSSHFF